MPITAEQEHEKRARRGRGWLWVPLGWLALVLLLLAVPLVHPITCSAGGWVLAAGFGPYYHSVKPIGDLVHIGQSQWVCHVESAWGGKPYEVDDDYPLTVHQLPLVRNVYYVSWFKGRRLR